MVNLVKLKKENKYLYEGLLSSLLDYFAFENEEQIIKEFNDESLKISIDKREALFEVFDIKDNAFDIARKFEELMFREIPEKEDYLKDDGKNTLSELLIDTQTTSLVLPFSWDDKYLRTIYETWYVIRKKGF